MLGNVQIADHIEGEEETASLISFSIIRRRAFYMSVAITSRQNPWFKRVRDALHEHRDEIVVEGPKFVADAVAAGWKPVAVFRVAGLPGLRVAGSEFELSAELFNSIAETKSPQNVLALFERPTFSLSSVLGPRVSVVVALDGVQDPGNVGTIVRLAAAFDCAGVLLLPGSADAYSPKTIRASVGAVLSVPIASATAADLIRSGLPMFAADARGSSVSLLPDDAIIVFGSEGRGVSDEVRSHSTPIAIPISPRVESLNVAVAAAILLAKIYEARRGR
jgi:RNA methyltransferase, TrmH family